MFPANNKNSEEIIFVKENQVTMKNPNISQGNIVYRTRIEIFLVKMIDFAKRNKWLVFTIAIVSVCFYWYQVRPGKIYSECNRIAQGKTDDKFRYLSGINENARAYYESVYKQCLRDKGLER